MVCRECGAYNAENLTHCRVCAAKLRDNEPAAAQPEAPAETQSDLRPARGFVAAPAWPTRAYADAPEAAAPAQPTQPAQPAQPASRAYTAQPASSYTPLAAKPAARASAPAPASPAVCPTCGKPALPDAPFCPYCGTKLAAAAPVPAPAATKPARAPQPAPVPAKPAKRKLEDDEFDDYDEDDDEFDDEDDEDEAPRRSKKPKAAKKPVKKAKKSRFEDDFDDEDDDDYLDDDEEDEDDEFDDDDMPKAHGKGSSFLLWGLILLLVILIAVFGLYIINKNNGGSSGSLLSGITSIFGGSKKPAEEGTETAAPIEGEIAAATESVMYTATISEYTDPTTNGIWYDILVNAPTGSTVRIVSDTELKTNTATVPNNNQITLRVGRDVFLPNAPTDNPNWTVTPNIQVDTPSGTTESVRVDPITITIPELSLNLDMPATETVQQSYSNSPVTISGTVAIDGTGDHTIEVYVNDQKIDVYAGGLFNTAYQPKRPVATQAAATAATAATTPAPETSPAADATPAPETSDDAAATETPAADAAATDDAAAAPAATTATGSYPQDEQGRETITIEARKNNYVTARRVIIIEPFVMQNTAINVTNSMKIDDIVSSAATSARAVDGKVTLTGTVTAGSTIAASTDDGSDLTFGEPTVDATGTFTLAVSVPNVGVHEIRLTAKQEGYFEGSTDVLVERAPDGKVTAFDKNCTNISKDYDKIAAGEITTGSYRDKSAKVTEIIATDPITIYRVDIGDNKTVVCAQRSLNAKINDGDVGEKKQIWGTLRGLYTDGTPYLWVWFSKNN